MDGKDLRRYLDGDELQDAFGKLLSGKSGYKPIIEKRIDPVCCKNCNLVVEGTKNFCPQCGSKLEKKPTSKKCSNCENFFDGDELFCAHCGKKRE